MAQVLASIYLAIGLSLGASACASVGGSVGASAGTAIAGRAIGEGIESGIGHIISNSISRAIIGKKKKKCLHPSTVVNLSSGERKVAMEVEAGDELLGIDKQRNILPTKVLKTLFAEANTRRIFVRFVTEFGNEVTVTIDHVIYAGYCNDSGWKGVEASQLSVGMCVPSYWNGKLQEDRVRSLERFEDFGIYQPFTDLGNLMADNVLISCYNSDQVFVNPAS